MAFEKLTDAAHRLGYSHLSLEFLMEMKGISAEFDQFMVMGRELLAPAVPTKSETVRNYAKAAGIALVSLDNTEEADSNPFDHESPEGRQWDREHDMSNSEAQIARDAGRDHEKLYSPGDLTICPENEPDGEGNGWADCPEDQATAFGIYGPGPDGSLDAVLIEHVESMEAAQKFVDDHTGAM